MRIVYTPRHQLHATDKVTVEGQPFSSEEVPARAEIISRAGQAARLGPVEAPTDHGLEPLLAVHDADFVGFLRDAYAQSAAHWKDAVSTRTPTMIFPRTGVIETSAARAEAKAIIGIGRFHRAPMTRVT